MKKNFLFIFVLFSITINAQIKILFDASKAQMAGNADWVIDTDLNNLGLGSGPAIVGAGSESNPQRLPTPAQSAISASTPETFWNGALSSWAVDCVKKGYVVETLPYNGQITYGVSTNIQDLSNYKVYIIDEPNINYTASEKNAIVSFVQNGGGLFMISDHDISDRNNDGIDSPTIFNELMVSNTIQPNAFGITFDLVSFSQTTTNVANLPGNPILNGSLGNVTSLKYSAGTSMTLNTTHNSSVKGLIYKNGTSNTGTTNVMCSFASFGTGKIVAIGDSSPPDDGTGDPGDVLYFGYTDINGNHQKLLMNATIWLATSNLSNNDFELNNFNFYIALNPIVSNLLNLNYFSSESNSFSVSILDNLGRTIKIENFSNTEIGLNSKNIAIEDLKSGVYFCKISNNSATKTLRFIVN